MSNIIEPNSRVNEISHRFIGIAIEVHRHLGAGYLEAIYEKALCHEMDRKNIRYQSQVEVPILYKGQHVGLGRLDLLIENELIVELKAVDKLSALHQAQVISYLKATNKQLGLLINFNNIILKQGIRRIVLSN